MRTLLLALALVAASPSLAEDTPTLGRAGVNLSFEALGHRFVLPTPDWLSPTERLSPDLLKLVESNTYGDASQAFAEFFPSGEIHQQVVADLRRTPHSTAGPQPRRLPARHHVWLLADL